MTTIYAHKRGGLRGERGKTTTRNFRFEGSSIVSKRAMGQRGNRKGETGKARRSLGLVSNTAPAKTGVTEVLPACRRDRWGKRETQTGKKLDGKANRDNKTGCAAADKRGKARKKESTRVGKTWTLLRGGRQLKNVGGGKAIKGLGLDRNGGRNPETRVKQKAKNPAARSNKTSPTPIRKKIRRLVVSSKQTRGAGRGRGKEEKTKCFGSN